jgi:hypothetical protein
MATGLSPGEEPSMSTHRIIAPAAPDCFETGDRQLPAPQAEVPAATRRRLMLALESIIDGATPEQLAGFLSEGFPPTVTAALERPWESEELSDHVNVLVSALAGELAPAVAA